MSHLGRPRVLQIISGTVFLLAFFTLVSDALACVTKSYEWPNPGSVRFVSYVQITELSQAFFDAKTDWDATPTRIGLVYDAGNPQVEGYNYSENDGYNGKTVSSFSGSTYLNAKIYLNWYYLSSNTANQRRGTAGHEWGHALGLGDTSGAVLMNPGRDRSVVFVPQPNDISCMNSQYP